VGHGSIAAQVLALIPDELPDTPMETQQK